MNAIKNLIEKLCDLVMHGRFSDETEVIANAVSEVMSVVATEELPEKHSTIMQVMLCPLQQRIPLCKKRPGR